MEERPEPIDMDSRADAPPPAVIASVPIRQIHGNQAQRDYVPRVIGTGLGALAVGSVLYEAGAALGWWLLLALNGLAWPHLAYLLAMRSRAPSRCEHRNLSVDAIMAGLWVVVMDFNLLVSAVVVTMVWLDNMAVAGERFFLKGMATTAASMLLAGVVLGFDWRPEPSMLNVMLSLPMLLVYPLVIGLWTHRLARRLHGKRKDIERLSQLDGLSGVNNRQYWEDLARSEFNRARRHGTPCSLLLLDIDRFKEFNDEHGHVAGDQVIRHVGRVLREQVRFEDGIGRYGGEEFGIILTATRGRDALTKAEAIRRAFRQDADLLGPITVSIGVAALTPDLDRFTQWVERADHALYRAKELGRDRCVAFGS